MASQPETIRERKRAGFSIDAWAVTLALLAALLVRIGLIKHVPW